MIHGYGVGMYYSMPVLIELLLQLTSDRASSIYTNSEVGKFETIVPIALLHSLVFFGGLSLGAAKIRYFYLIFYQAFLSPVRGAGDFVPWLTSVYMSLADDGQTR